MTRKQAAFCMGYFHGDESKKTLHRSEVERRWPHLNEWEVAAYCGGRVAGQGGRVDLLPVKQFDINQVSRFLRESI